MDLLKAKINLDKINRSFTQLLKDPDNIPKIEVDITLSYVRELYDALQTAYPPQVTPPPPPQAHLPQTPPPPPAVPPVSAPIAVAPPPPVVEAPAPPPPPVPSPIVERPSPMSIVIPLEMEPLFEYKEAKELSEKLSESPIPDIKKALSLNDRLLIQRELFANDPAAFEHALNQLNSCSGMDAAQQFLAKECVYPYDWLSKSRVETAKWFIRMVRRRHKPLTH